MLLLDSSYIILGYLSNSSTIALNTYLAYYESRCKPIKRRVIMPREEEEEPEEGEEWDEEEEEEW